MCVRKAAFNGDNHAYSGVVGLRSFSQWFDPSAASSWGEHTLMNSTADSSLCRFRAVLFFVVTVPACKCTCIVLSQRPQLAACPGS